MKKIPFHSLLRRDEVSYAREFTIVFAVLLLVTVTGWFLPLSYHALGHIYLFTVIALSLCTSRGPAVVAAIVSTMLWNYVFIPPRLNFAVFDFDDTLMLGTYFVVAVAGSQLTARLRDQQRHEMRGERHASALLRLTHALTGSHTFDEGVSLALRCADEIFEGKTALIQANAVGELQVHPASSFWPDPENLHFASNCITTKEVRVQKVGSKTGLSGLQIPLMKSEVVFGVLAISWQSKVVFLSTAGRDLAEGFASQIALLVERERLRAASEKEKLLEESERLQRTLLDSVSHELKTPLAVLRTSTEGLETTDLKKRSMYVSEITKATHRLEHLVSNLLNQSRLESGTVRPQLDWCDVRDLISGARRGAGEATEGRSIIVTVALDMPLLFVDAPLIEQALQNLLVNAAHHTAAGRPVKIFAGVEDGDQRAFIAVGDDGEGISAELSQDLFRKFHRGKKAKAGGLGLGLSIVRGFCEAHGGEVVASNNVEGGACFKMFLPVHVHSLVPSDER